MESNWQPIETAPRDGTRVVVWGVAVAEVGDGSNDTPVAMDAAWEHNRFRVTATTYYSLDVYPTHWMPLPAPPRPD